MQVEAIERQLTPIAAALVAAGAEKAWSLVDDARARFDADLVAEPVLDPLKRLLRERGIA